MTLSPVQRRIAKLVALGHTYPAIAALLAPDDPKWESNTRLVRHHADVAARLLLPKSTLPTRQRLTLWWHSRS